MGPLPLGGPGSRLAAARLPLARIGSGSLSVAAPRTAAALKQEFGGSTLTRAVAAFANCTDRTEVPDSELTTEFTPDRLSAYLDSEAGHAVRIDIGKQASLFERHLRSSIGNHSLALVVDTGLYGTTQMLLEEGVPELRIASLMFAKTTRPNTEPSPAIGLSVDSSGYIPWQRRTCVLRFWHLLEEMLEPEIPSVRRFELIEGDVVSDLEVPDWKARLEPPIGTDSLFAGAMSYLRSLDHDGVKRIRKDSPSAWRVLHRALVWPRKQDWELLQPSDRSHDFGRSGHVSGRIDEGLRAVLTKRSLWREGEVARTASLARTPVLGLIECAHSVRTVSRALKRR